MWPMHARSKEEYIRQIHSYLDRKEHAPLDETLQQAFSDYAEEEDFSAWCAGVAHGVETASAMELTARFIERYPFSLHPVQVDLAEMLVRNDQVDEGSNEARAYLNRLHQMGLRDQISVADAVEDGVCRAFLLLTAVYTQVGARSYSSRVLGYAMLIQDHPYWSQQYRMELMRLERELEDPVNRRADQAWEEFFRCGKESEELSEEFRKLGYRVLSKRIETLAKYFADEPDFRPGDDEIFQMLYRTDKGAFVLV
ncbi:hypothetical protein KQI84_16390 [bacterium]|nr:hypothetical protein [bacterium]